MTSDTQPPNGVRQKRFKRNDSAPPIRMTERDVEILRQLARFRFLSSTQIHRLVGGSAQQVLRRLRAGYDHGHIERPRAQVAEFAHFHDDGNRPLAYALATRGARVLANHGYGAIDRLDWTTKNSRATSDFLAHTLETADVMIGFEIACRDESTPRLVDHHALLPYLPESTRTDDDPFRLDVSVRHAGHDVGIAVIPDRLFSLFVDTSSRLNFGLELDRGTMDIRSKQLVGKSSFRRKLLGYWQAYRDQVHTERWGFKAFRVLTVTTSDARIKTMMEVQREIVGAQGSNMFLFTTLERYRVHSPFDSIWLSGKGETVSLLPASRTSTQASSPNATAAS